MLLHFCFSCGILGASQARTHQEPSSDELALLWACWLQGYRDALAWLLKNGKVPYGVSDADTTDTADSAAGEQQPAWRQRLNNTLASIRVQVRGSC